jgi:hypothetical protein
MVKERRALGLLFGPSWFSGLIVILAALALVISTVVAMNFHGSSLEFLINDKPEPQVTSTTVQSIDDRFSSNALISNIPLFIFWGAIGVIAYTFTMSIIGALQNVVDLREEMDYVHVNRRQLLREAGTHLIVRLVALLAWLAYANFSLHFLLPYVVASAQAGSGGLGWLASTGYIVWAIVVATITLHIHVVLARLLWLRPRLFGDING